MQAGLSQSDVEKRCGVPKTMLSRYENGHVSPSIDTLMRIAGALEVSPCELLNTDASPIRALVDELDRLGVHIANADEARSVAQAIASVDRAQSVP